MRKEKHIIVGLNKVSCHWRAKTLETWSPEKFDQNPTINVNRDHGQGLVLATLEYQSISQLNITCRSPAVYIMVTLRMAIWVELS